MDIQSTDIAIVAVYLFAIVGSSIYFSRQPEVSAESYFLAGRRIPWYVLGISNASGMFDIAGTMWLVSLIFVYGIKSVWLLWVWPIWNQIFLMVYLAAWIRRSKAVTGADWLRTRFTAGWSLEASHLVTVFYSLVVVVGGVAFAFRGIGKFGYAIFPWQIGELNYGLIFVGLTTCYVTLGGMRVVVVTDVLQFVLMTIISIWIGWLALEQTTAQSIAAAVPDGWGSFSSIGSWTWIGPADWPLFSRR